VGVGYTVRRESEFGRMQEGLRIRRETNERTMPLRGEKREEAKIIYQSKRDLSKSGEEIELRTTQVLGL
jgi:hypothetical protein